MGGRLEINYRNVGRILKGEVGRVDEVLQEIGELIASDAGLRDPEGEYGVSTQVGATRVRTLVYTDNYEAMRAEADDRTLTRALEAGRGI